MYAAFPRSEYLWASPTSTVASASLRMVLSVGLLGRHANQDGGGSPRFLTLPFPDVPCSKTPPQSPAIIANSDRLLLPSRYSTLSACGCRLTRLNRFTCVTACPSLCLRLAHVVTSISPRLDFRWGGLTPCRSHRFLSGVPWPTPDAPKGCRRSAPHSGQVIPWRSRTMPAPFCLIDRPHRPVDMLAVCHCRRTWPLFVRAGVDPTSCDSQCDEPSGQTPITFWRKRSTARSATISTVILWATIAFHRAFRARPLPC